MLLDLADACRASGLRVVEVAGWRTRGHGPMRGVRTIVCHHTAGPPTGDAPSLDYVRDNRLSQLVLGRSGTVYVVAAGLCWHAGVVHAAEQSNAWALGIEAEATGRDEWPPVQYDAYARLVHALCVAYALPVSRALGHKEVAYPLGRKVDPNFDMPTFRAAVAALTEEDDMFTDSDRALLATLARRGDVGFARDQVLSRLGVVDPVAYPDRRTPAEIERDDPARRVDVGHARDQLVTLFGEVLDRLDGIEARLPAVADTEGAA